MKLKHNLGKLKRNTVRIDKLHKALERNNFMWFRHV